MLTHWVLRGAQRLGRYSLGPCERLEGGPEQRRKGQLWDCPVGQTKGRCWWKGRRPLADQPWHSYSPAWRVQGWRCEQALQKVPVVASLAPQASPPRQLRQHSSAQY